jgi:lysophospholipase L1-like esterase
MTGGESWVMEPADMPSSGGTVKPSENSARPGRAKQLLGTLVPIFVSLVFGFALAEIITRVAFRRGMDFDMEMWKYATEIKVPNDDPKVVHEHRPNGRAFLMGVEVTTESHGLRDRERSVAKPPNTFRIVALGDSITMAWGVAQDNAYPQVLERLLNSSPPAGFPKGLRYEVLNLGVGNYNTVQEVMRLKNLGLKFDPDLVTLGFFINDAEPTPKPSRGFLIEHSYLFAFVASRMRLASGAVGTYKDYYERLYGPDQPGWKESQAALGELARLTRERRIPAEVFLIPELHRLQGENQFAGVYESVANACREHGLPVTNLYPVFQGRSPEEALWVHPLDAHHNAEAQSIMAKAMRDRIEAMAPELVGSPRFQPDPSAL